MKMSNRLYILKNMFDELDDHESELFYEHPECDMISKLCSVNGYVDSPLAIAMGHYTAYLIYQRGFVDAYNDFVHKHNEFVMNSVTYKYYLELFSVAFTSSPAILLMANTTLDTLLINGLVDTELGLLGHADVFCELWESRYQYFSDLEDIAKYALSVIDEELYLD